MEIQKGRRVSISLQTNRTVDSVGTMDNGRSLSTESTGLQASSLLFPYKIQNPMQAYDHIILGTGQATGTLLGGLLSTDESIAIIEGHHIGGTCVNVGCTPTKTLVASARVAHVVSRAPEFGVHPAATKIDFQEVMERMNNVRSASRQGLEGWITSQAQITLYRAWGSFAGERHIQVGNETIKGKNIYINVGMRPRVPAIPGIEETGWLDNSSLLELDELPERLVIVGGSYIGLEFAQVFSRFGSKVTVIEYAPRLTPREDEDVSAGIREILEEEGIDIHVNARVTRASNTDTGSISVEFDQHGELHSVEGSHLFLAVGTQPNSDRIAPENANIRLDDRGFIAVDDYCRTSAEGIFALGDVNGHGAFTHTAVNDAEIVLDLMRGGNRKLSDRIPIYALFIDPALGRVGLSEKEAIDRGHNVLKATRNMSKISRAKEMGETKGFVKLLVDADTDLILGASILGAGGDEIINMFAAFMYAGLPCRQYRKSVLVHPTISELMPWILDTLKPV